MQAVAGRSERSDLSVPAYITFRRLCVRQHIVTRSWHGFWTQLVFLMHTVCGSECATRSISHGEPGLRGSIRYESCGSAQAAHQGLAGAWKHPRDCAAMAYFSAVGTQVGASLRSRGRGRSSGPLPPTAPLSASHAAGDRAAGEGGPKGHKIRQRKAGPLPGARLAYLGSYHPTHLAAARPRQENPQTTQGLIPCSLGLGGERTLLSHPD